MKGILTQERLKELLHYDPESGKFTRLKAASNHVVGELAGWLTKDGYRLIKIDGKQYRCARLVFLYMTGRLPLQADHVNRIRHDDRWANIREADNGQNNANKNIQRNNTSGIKCASWDSRRNRWHVRVHIRGKQRHVGYFEDFELAELAAAEARNKAYGDFA